MMKPLYKQPLVEAVILASGILCTVVLIHGVQNFIALGGKPVTSQIAQKSNPDLVNVASGGCEGLGDIDKRGQNGSQDPAKVPTDAFNDFGMVKNAGLTPAPESDKKFGDNISTADRDALHINLDGLVDGSITLANVWSVSPSYRSDSSSAVHKNEVIAISTTPGQVIKTPSSGRMILDGSNLSGMVMYVSGDGVRFANSRNDKPTGQEGYNLYIWGITPDPGLVSRYQCANDTLGRQKMPEMHVGDPLGTANGDFIYLALRDNGAFQDLLDTSWWNGRIKAGDTTGAAAAGVTPAASPDPTGPERSVTDGRISGEIILNDVVNRHKELFENYNKKNMVIVAGDSNTNNITFTLDKYSIQNKSEGSQGANWLKSQTTYFIDGSKFALILIGINEVHNPNSNPAAGIKSDFEANLKAIVSQTLAKRIIPVLQEVNDFNNTGNIQSDLAYVNAVIRTVTSNNSIPLVRTSYVTKDHVESDGYHFNAAGKELRNQILRQVNQKLDEAVASVRVTPSPTSPVISTPATISPPATVTPMTTNYPSWATSTGSCIDDTLRSNCDSVTTNGYFIDIHHYCSELPYGTRGRYYPLVEKRTYAEPCSFFNRPYLVGTRSVAVEDASGTLFTTVSQFNCKYTVSAQDNTGNNLSIVCANDPGRCAGICTLPQTIDLKFNIQNNKSVPVVIQNIEFDGREDTTFTPLTISPLSQGSTNLKINSDTLKRIIALYNSRISVNTTFTLNSFTRTIRTDYSLPQTGSNLELLLVIN